MQFWQLLAWLAVLANCADGLVKFEPGTVFREVRTPVQTSSIVVRYQIDINPHALDSNTEINSLESLLLKGTEGLNASIKDTAILMRETNKQIDSHYDSISHKANLLRRKRSGNPLAFIGDLLGWCCSVATKSDITVALENDELIQYQLDSIFTAFDEVINVTQHNNLEWTNFVGDVHDKFLTIDNALSKILNSNKWMTDWFTHVTLRSISSTTEMVIKLLMTERLDQIYSSCTQNQIPLSIISPEMLQTEIDTLNSKLGPKAEIAVTSLSALYKLKIVTCVFKDKSLEVVVKYPVRRKGENWKIIDIVPTPFAYRNFICKILAKPTMIVSNSSNIRILSEQQRSDCIDGLICPLPRETSYNADLGSCVNNIYTKKNRNLESIRKTCQFQCTPYFGPEILGLGLNDYVLVHPKHDLVVDCPGNAIFLSAVPVGASRVNIPCDCVLRQEQNVLIDTQYPCDPRLNNVFNRTVILPSLWSKTNKPWSAEPEKYVHPALKVSNVISKNQSFTLPDFVVMSGPQKPTGKIQTSLSSDKVIVYVLCGVLLGIQTGLIIWMIFIQRSISGSPFKRAPTPALTQTTRRRRRRDQNDELEDIELDNFRTRYAARL